VLAGPHASLGGSEAEEREYRAARPEVDARAADLGAVEEDEKRWLLRRASGVVYPSLYEGFGLVPFEAAHAGVPCFFAWGTALRELLPREAVRLVEWDADASADLVFPALAGGAEADELVRLVRDAGASLTWDRTATLVLDAYEEVLREARAPAATLAAEVGSPAALAARISARSLDDVALPDDVYRAFLAFTTRPRLRRLLFGALTLAHRAGTAARRRRLPQPGDDRS
jgi:hypothetical protein